MSLEISSQTESRLIENARALGLSVEAYLQQLMGAEEQEFIAAVEEGLRDVEEGRVKPARTALPGLGKKLGFSS
jgi:hypothetical protein